MRCTDRRVLLSNQRHRALWVQPGPGEETEAFAGLRGTGASLAIWSPSAAGSHSQEPPGPSGSGFPVHTWRMFVSRQPWQAGALGKEFLNSLFAVWKQLLCSNHHGTITMLLDFLILVLQFCIFIIQKTNQQERPKNCAVNFCYVLHPDLPVNVSLHLLSPHM